MNIELDTENSVRIRGFENKEKAKKTVEAFNSFDDIDKENICGWLQNNITKHREESTCEFLMGKISKNVNDWNQRHADYVEEIMNNIITILNACPSIEKEE